MQTLRFTGFKSAVGVSDVKGQLISADGSFAVTVVLQPNSGILVDTKVPYMFGDLLSLNRELFAETEE